MKLQRNLLFKLSAISALFLISCGTSRRVLDARENALFNKWIGHSKNQLVSQWGQPDSVSTDGKKRPNSFIQRKDGLCECNEWKLYRLAIFS